MRFGILLALLLLIVSCKSPEVDSDHNNPPVEVPVSSAHIDTNKTASSEPSIPVEKPVSVNPGEPTHSEPPSSQPEPAKIENPFGPDSAPGVADDDCDGTPPKPHRVRLNDPVFTDIEVDEQVDIELILTIDNIGNVIAATFNKFKTSTSDQNLINRVIFEVKKQIKYNKAPGSPLVKVSMHVTLSPE